MSLPIKGIEEHDSSVPASPSESNAATLLECSKEELLPLRPKLRAGECGCSTVAGDAHGLVSR